MIICESWLNESTSDEELQIPNYEIYRSDRRDGRRGGGVCAYIKERNRSTEITTNTLKPEFLECLWNFLPLYNVIVLSIYVSPNLTAPQISEVTIYVVRTADSVLDGYRDSRLIIAGDLNRFPTTELEHNLGLTQVVNSSTRKNSILDKIFIDSAFLETSLNDDKQLTDRPFEVIILPKIGNSDHETVYIKPSIKRPEERTWVKVYDLRKSHLDVFRKKISTFPWHTLYRTNEPIDYKCEVFYNVIQEAMQAIPYDLVEMKPKDKPWITPKLKSLIDKRFQAYRKREFSLYYHYKEKLKKEIHKAKMHWVSKKRKAPNGLWSVVRNATNKNCKIPIHKITDSYPSLAEAANAINEKFGSLYPDLPSWTSILKDFNNSSSDWNVQLQVQDVLELLLKVNTSKACGSDELHPKIIKAAAHELAEPLTHLFAISIESGTIPKKWKLAHVVPVPKNKKPTLDTLRPISLLPIFSKLLEKVVLNSVLPSLLRLYGPNQFGFRPSTSTLHAHICIHDHVTRLLDCDEIAGVIMTTYDMSKAFDTLSHKALFSSLRESDLPNGFLNWYSNFLRDRKQSVRILHVTSTSIVNVTSGVPQGSVMAPYLFAAHMGKLAPNDGKCLTIKYADDIVTLIPAYNTSNVDKIVKDKIHDMEIWCKTHGLVLNSDKTNSLLIRKSGIPSNQLPATELMNRAELRILGVTYERNLSWSAHINNACKRASQRFYILRKLKRLLAVSRRSAVNLQFLDCEHF